MSTNNLVPCPDFLLPLLIALSLCLVAHPGSSANDQLERVFRVDDHGFRGDGKFDDTQIFRNIWKIACSSSREARILIPSGNTYVINPIDFGGPCQSKITLQISGNIVGPTDPEEWEGLDTTRWMYFHGIIHLTIEGGGIVNGRGDKWWERICKTGNACQEAPTAFKFHKCDDLTIRDLEIINGQHTHVTFTNCHRVTASDLKIQAPSTSPNTDGIHISSSHDIDISSSEIGTGDDCVSIVGNSSTIVIRDISCGPGHGISIGSLGISNSWSQVRDVIVQSSILSETEFGLRIKTWQGGSGFAKDIIFQNVLMKNVGHPIVINQYYCDSFVPCLNQTSAVKVANISFVNIKGTTATSLAMMFACSDNSPCEGLYLEDVHLESYYGGKTRSFCWMAQGSTSGLVQPPPCFSPDDSFIKQETSPGSAAQSI
ncbi:hypothetical protein MLD38_005601 [Melastoma candidum]|uniref:Uncharacterized protein n=1 Tax=Melastoma candidum TaxID=119954 RepID=A0ACB9RLD3_9MYRT|nr:hypothetical protein MLD38_005601 [Melastoma candidum]